MKKSDLLAYLEKIGARPRKSLSQNFLIDGNIIRKIVQLAEIQPGDHVLEIGPGPGALTTALLDAGAHVLAIEKDKLFAEHLPRHPNLTVHCEDVLKFPFESITQPHKVVSNVPYHITAPILEKLIDHLPLFESITLTVQKEVVDRLRAKPSTKQYSSLTIFLQFYTTFHSSFPISPSCFYPEPSVESATMRLDPRIPPPVDPKLFFSIVRRAFQQRRKTLSSSLREIKQNIPAILQSMGLSPMARPEELSLDQWVEFVKKIEAIHRVTQRK